MADDKIDALLARWTGLQGGAERKNFAPFIYDLIDALDLPRPEPGIAGKLGDYEFEGTVAGGSAKQTGAGGSADLYKRGCFVMEAKQSWLPPGAERAPGLFDAEAAIPLSPTGAAYDKLMVRAQAQAKNYAVNLPGDHPPVPFLIVCDIGRAFEIYFDAAGNGRGYGFFPDAKGYRIPLPRLRDPEVQALLRDIWTNPAARDPKLRAADVTRKVTARLAAVSKWLEETQRLKTSHLSAREQSLAVEETALFVMRLLFCMFAEDIGLLPKNRFTQFLEESVDDDRNFDNGLADLWTKMNAPLPGRWSWVVREDVRYFNGGLFESAATYRLSREARGELLSAARHNWRNVEPAIFGTLLEQALVTSERAKLGAHYTPRAYVERLVDATIMEVLNGEWAEVQERLTDPATDAAASRRLAADFHERLAAVRVLDPACGTGNFLYVAMEAIERLEAQVIEVRRQLGEAEIHSRITPAQFLGLEKNPRAAKIAELVLWIGWLRFRIDNDPDSIVDPVLGSAANINFGRHGGYDAVLDEATDLIPDWPEAEFIVGNPPFIGKGAAMRAMLGDDYVEALARANPRVAQSADFVMQWWDRAAHILTAPESPLRRFGFVTTNSITQTFNRRVIESYLHREDPPRDGEVAARSADGGGGRQEASPQDAAPVASPLHPRPAAGGPPPRPGEDRASLSLVFAIPDHPWTKASRDAAAVRIAMTAAEAGAKPGRLIKVASESALDTDAPVIQPDEAIGTINADLSVGADVVSAQALRANVGLANTGMMLAGQGFKLDAQQASYLRRLDPNSDEVIRPFISGGSLMRTSERISVIDLFGLDEKTVRQRYSAIYQHLLLNVKPERDQNKRSYRKTNWWLFGENNPLMRKSLAGLQRFIATTETAKHRAFQFVDGATAPDHMAVTISSADAFHLGVLSSAIHVGWALARGGTLEDRPRYNKASCFDPFPFPDPSPEHRAAIAEIAEELDATRKTAIAEVERLTMTEIYNLRAKLKAGTLTPPEQERAMRARVGIVAKLHDDLDEAVAAAYGWDWPLPPQEIVARLVALNAARAAEEAAGQVRWLRPDYQAPRFGKAGV